MSLSLLGHDPTEAVGARPGGRLPCDQFVAWQRHFLSLRDYEDTQATLQKAEGEVQNQCALELSNLIYTESQRRGIRYHDMVKLWKEADAAGRPLRPDLLAILAPR